MAENGFRYVLRYKIDPQWQAEDRIEELVRFCRASRIREVMLLSCAEELFPGHPTAEELDRYVDLGRRLKARLGEIGAELSLNPWSTTAHNGRGRRLRAGQDFTLMVGETGATAEITACPRDEAFAAYLCESFARLAGGIEPIAIWVEDDFRLHNHGDELGYGGCFCELCLGRFAALAGEESVTREQVLSAVLREGDPHPWRQVWMRLCGETMTELAGRLAAAVREASPQTRLGLMCSNPAAHSVEGRDWDGFIEALGTEPAFLMRPCLSPYTETRPLESPPSAARETLSCVAGPREVYPELESSPRCGPYSKSRAFASLQCFAAAAYGSDGITINHYDMLGCGISLDPRFGEALAASRPRLDALVALGLDDRRAMGPAVFFDPHVAARLRLDPQDGPRDSLLSLRDRGAELFSTTLSILGVAHGFARPAEAAGRPVVCGGHSVETLDDEQVRRMLAGPVLLDAVAVQCLLRRGYGELLGLKGARRRPLAEAAYSYERIDGGRAADYGIDAPRMSAQRCSPWSLELLPAAGCEARTQVCGPDHRSLWPGLTLFENALGGRVSCLCWPVDDQRQFFMGYFNAFRRILMQSLLVELAPDAPQAFVEESPLHAYFLEDAAGRAVLFAHNTALDSASRVVFRISGRPLDVEALEALDGDGTWRALRPQAEDAPGGQRLIVSESLAPLDCLVLREVG